MNYIYCNPENFNELKKTEGVIKSWKGKIAKEYNSYDKLTRELYSKYETIFMVLTAVSATSIVLFWIWAFMEEIGSAITAGGTFDLLQHPVLLGIHIATIILTIIAYILTDRDGDAGYRYEYGRKYHKESIYTKLFSNYNTLYQRLAILDDLEHTVDGLIEGNVVDNETCDLCKFSNFLRKHQNDKISMKIEQHSKNVSIAATAVPDKISSKDGTVNYVKDTEKFETTMSHNAFAKTFTDADTCDFSWLDARAEEAVKEAKQIACNTLVPKLGVVEEETPLLEINEII